MIHSTGSRADLRKFNYEGERNVYEKIVTCKLVTCTINLKKKVYKDHQGDLEITCGMKVNQV